MSRTPNPSKKQLARDTLATIAALSKAAGMDMDSSRESSPEYPVFDEPPPRSSMQIQSSSASLAQGRGSAAASAQPREEGIRSRAPSIFSESDIEGRGRGRGRGLSQVREEGEMDDDDDDDDRVVTAKGTKRQASPALVSDPKKQAVGAQAMGPQTVGSLPRVPPKAASRTGRSASKNPPGANPRDMARLPFPPEFRAYNPNPNPNERAVSPSTGPSKGWYLNQIADGVLQNSPAAGGGPASVQIDKTRENQVVVSVKESMTEKQMHKAFEERLKSMEKRKYISKNLFRD